MRRAPYEIQLERLEKLGVRTFQEFGGFVGPRYWKLTMPDGEIEFACTVRKLKEIADRIEAQSANERYAAFLAKE